MDIKKFRETFDYSKKGNLWRKWGDLVLTIFTDDWGRYSWCAATDEGKSYSQRKYNSEEDALQSLANAVDYESSEEYLEEKSWEKVVEPWEQIVRAWYHEMTKKYHPDRGGSHEIMAAINGGMEKLKELFTEAGQLV